MEFRSLAAWGGALWGGWEGCGGGRGTGEEIEDTRWAGASTVEGGQLVIWYWIFISGREEECKGMCEGVGMGASG